MDILMIGCIICGKDASVHPGVGHTYIGIDSDQLKGLRRAIQFRNEEQNGPGSLYVQLEDRLRVVVTNSVAGAEADVTARMLMPDGQIIIHAHQMFPTSNRQQNVLDVGLAEGYLLSVTVNTPTAAVRKGQMFANISLVRGTSAAPLFVYDLTEGYVVAGNDIGWPFVDSLTSVDGEGFVKSAQIGNPAAGADWSGAVPVGVRWRFQSITAQLVTSGVAGNRVVTLQVKDSGGNLMASIPPLNAQIAGQTVIYTWADSFPLTLSQGNALAPLPANMKVFQQWTVGVSTTNKDVGDQWSNISLNVQEWLEL